MTFSTVATYFAKIEAQSSRLSITELLADLFRNVESEDIGVLSYVLMGRVGPLYEPLEFGMADKFVMRAIAQSLSLDLDQVQSMFRSTGDLGKTVKELRNKNPAATVENSKSLREVYTILKEVTSVSGDGSQDRKIQIFAELLSDLDPLSAKYVVRIPLGKMRLGFSDMTVLDALSWMLSGDKSYRKVLEEAYNVRPDIGYIATTIKQDGVDALSHIQPVVGAPILPCLCQRVPTFTEMIEKMGEVVVEPKYDGVRVQIHVQQSGVITYSRNLEVTTAMFPELAQIRTYLAADECILDAEAVGIDNRTGAILPFQQTTTRKRKHGIQQALQDIPLRFFVFDILYKDGRSLLSTSLEERKKILAATLKDDSVLSLSPYTITSDPEVLRSYHEKQRNQGLEGIVVKKLHAPYEPGRKGYTWVKLKEEEGAKGKLGDTIDAVIMGYYRGEGKRTSFGVGALLAGVKRGEEFVTICKIGTGVSDELWKEFKRNFKVLETSQKPRQYADVDSMLLPDVWLEPELVVEIAGDDLTVSRTHGAGYAIRFPRLIKVRDDKSPEQATTREEVVELYTNQ